VESFDPQAALFAMNQVIYRASIESWGERLFNAAFGSHSDKVQAHFDNGVLKVQIPLK
jgi:hypothetical protein